MRIIHLSAVSPSPVPGGDRNGLVTRDGPPEAGTGTKGVNSLVVLELVETGKGERPTHDDDEPTTRPGLEKVPPPGGRIPIDRLGNATSENRSVHAIAQRERDDHDHGERATATELDMWASILQRHFARLGKRLALAGYPNAALRAGPIVMEALFVDGGVWTIDPVQPSHPVSQSRHPEPALWVRYRPVVLIRLLADATKMSQDAHEPVFAKGDTRLLGAIGDLLATPMSSVDVRRRSARPRRRGAAD